MKKLLSANGLIPHFSGLLRFFFLFVFFVSIRFSVISQNISINTTGNPANSSALLEVGENANLTAGGDTKGFLCPHVSLASITDVATVASPANGLIVYNTNAAMTNGNGVGLYYYCSSGCSTTGWKFMAAANNGPGASGQVLTSQGAGNAPQWAAGGGGNCFTNWQLYYRADGYTTATATSGTLGTGTPGSFTVPAGVTTVKVVVWGGGGGGCSCTGATLGGAGGGGGGYAEGIFTVTPTNVYTSTVGTGGSAGGGGGTTTLTGAAFTISATGGSATLNAIGGAGGIGSGGYLNTTLGNGGSGGGSTASPYMPGLNGGGEGGSGGAPLSTLCNGGGGGGGYGGGNGAYYNNSGTNAAANAGAGGGGSVGACGGCSSSGGNGAGGRILIFW
ncbi:MAG: hypothetical protein HY063_13940 [Bacteroidetes bacterium]|nr:hypothetical protein [Bacteroidota bacterium]